MKKNKSLVNLDKIMNPLSLTLATIVGMLMLVWIIMNF